MLIKLARAFTKDIQLIIKRKFCLRRIETPIVYKIRDAVLAEKHKIEEEEKKLIEEAKIKQGGKIKVLAPKQTISQNKTKTNKLNSQNSINNNFVRKDSK